MADLERGVLMADLERITELRRALAKLPASDGCNEWTCLYHGKANEQRALLEREIRILEAGRG